MKKAARSRPAYGLWDRLLRDWFEDPLRAAPSASRAFLKATKKPLGAVALAGGVIILSASAANNGNMFAPTAASAEVHSAESQLLSTASPVAIEIAGLQQPVPAPQIVKAETPQPKATPVQVAAADSQRPPSLNRAMLARDAVDETTSPVLQGRATAMGGFKIPVPSLMDTPAAATVDPIVTASKTPTPDAGPKLVRRPERRATFEQVSNKFEKPSWISALFHGKGNTSDIKLTAYAEIAQAADSAGANPGGLLTTAFLETGLNPTLGTRTSTAVGPFQYIEQTWFAELKAYGGLYGYQSQADSIVRVKGRHGRTFWTVRDAHLRKQILDLRKDPWLSTMVTVEVMKEYQAMLEKAHLGRDITSNDLHMCHVFGEAGGLKFLRTMAKTPNMAAYKLFDANVVGANHNVFFNKKGEAYTLQSVYRSYGKNFAPADRLLKPAPDSDKPPVTVPVEQQPAQKPVTTPATTQLSQWIKPQSKGVLSSLWGLISSGKPANDTRVVTANIRGANRIPNIG